MAYHVKTKAVPGLCFHTWYAKKTEDEEKNQKESVGLYFHQRLPVSLHTQTQTHMGMHSGLPSSQVPVA